MRILQYMKTDYNKEIHMTGLDLRQKGVPIPLSKRNISYGQYHVTRSTSDVSTIPYTCQFHVKHRCSVKTLIFL